MNIRDIAKLSGVSPSTVSKILNHNDSSISDLTKQKVLEIVKDYNYRPYSFVNNAHYLKTNILGVVFRDTIPDDRFLKGLIEKVRSYGYGMTVLESRKNQAQELKNLSLLSSNNVDGILLNPIQDELGKEVLSQLEQNKKPYQLFHMNHSVPGSDSGLANLYPSMAYYLTEQLIHAGHSKIALIAETDDPAGAVFIEGYRQCMYANSINISNDLIFETDSDIFYQRVASGSISAVLTLHFQTCFRVYQQLDNRHIRIPDDVSLLTLCRHLTNIHNFSEISALLIPFQEYGEHLATLLVHKIENKEDSQDDCNFHISYTLNHTKSIAEFNDSRKKRIVVVGSINIDSYFTFSELPHTGMTAKTTRSAAYTGGKGMNQAVGSSNLGHNVYIIGMVGDDIEADTVYEMAKQKSIDTQYLKRNRNSSTGHAYIFLDPNGNSMISILSGANEKITADYIRKSANAFSSSDICLINTEIPQPAIVEACKISKEHHIPTIIKPSSVTEIDKQILSMTDILVPNLEEVIALVPGARNMIFNSNAQHNKHNAIQEDTLSKCADYFLNQGVNMVIITLGENGMYVKGNHICKLIHAPKVMTIDATGAADAFISALASYILYGHSTENAIRIASYAAALSVTREGVVPSLVDKNTLESYISRMEPNLLNKIHS